MRKIIKLFLLLYFIRVQTFISRKVLMGLMLGRIHFDAKGQK